MIKSFRTIVFLCLPLALAPFLAPASGETLRVAELEAPAVADDLALVGVEELAIERMESPTTGQAAGYTIELLLESGVVMATATVEYNPGKIKTVLEAEEGVFAVEFNKEAGELRIEGPLAGELGVRKFDQMTQSWVWEKTAGEALEERYSASFRTAAALAALMELERRPLAEAREDLPTTETNPADVQERPVDDCNYDFTHRGFGVHVSRSICCFYAKQDVDNQCNNFRCWGCCKVLSCDAACGLGDYGCFCGITGIECDYTHC